MPKRKPKQSMRKRGKGSGANPISNPPGPSTIVYRGPSRLPEQVTPEIKTVELHSGASFTSTAGGVVDVNGFSSQVRTLGDDFSSWAALYREYRVLAVRYEFHPNVIGATIGAILYTPIYTVVDRLDTSSVAAYANVESNTSLSIYTLNQKWMREAKMFDISEADFVAVTADGPAYGIKCFVTGLTASTNYGRSLIRWVVQFRTRD